MGNGKIGFQADGFLILPDRLVDLAFLVESEAEIVVREVIVLRDFQRMPEKGFTVLPIPQLLPRQPKHRTIATQPATDNAITWYRQRRVSSYAPQITMISTPSDGI